MVWNTFAVIGMIVVTYFAIGLVVGVINVSMYLARFFSGGWQVKRMVSHMMTVAVFWPLAIQEMWSGR